MKIKKTITAKVMAANRANGRKTGGPHDTNSTRENALKHGLLARHLIFRDEEESNEFNRLLHELEFEYAPAGPTERTLVEEVASCIWKLKTANGWEIREIRHRRQAGEAILRAVAENYCDEQISLFTKDDGSLGWDCQELIVRTGSAERDLEEFSREKKAKAGNVQIEAKLTNSLDCVLRYQSALKRDLYRAIAALADINERRGGEGPLRTNRLTTRVESRPSAETKISQTRRCDPCDEQCVNDRQFCVFTGTSVHRVQDADCNSIAKCSGRPWRRARPPQLCRTEQNTGM
jgi:hypothetical protein